MQFRKAMVQREIETAAVVLGFPRRVSLARVGRELERYCPRTGKPELDSKDAPTRFRAVGELFILMIVARDLDGEIEKLKKDVCKRAVRVRKLAGVATRAAA
jgi:hypothetical protein